MENMSYWRERAEKAERELAEAKADLAKALSNHSADLSAPQSATQETNEEIAKRAAKNISNSAKAQCFRWLVKKHGGVEIMPNGSRRCWIGGVEFSGDDVEIAIIDAIDREEGSSSGGTGDSG
jgi:hypothetical protein